MSLFKAELTLKFKHSQYTIHGNTSSQVGREPIWSTAHYSCMLEPCCPGLCYCRVSVTHVPLSVGRAEAFQQLSRSHPKVNPAGVIVRGRQPGSCWNTGITHWFNSARIEGGSVSEAAQSRSATPATPALFHGVFTSWGGDSRYEIFASKKLFTSDSSQGITLNKLTLAKSPQSCYFTKFDTTGTIKLYTEKASLI